jgi:hypothetical protein
MPELIRRMNAWQDSVPGVWNKQYKRYNHKSIAFSFMTVMAPDHMDPAIFGAGVFEEDFKAILAEMRENTDSERSAKEHMQGIAQQISTAPRNVKSINVLKEYLSEMDRRRNTNWQELFPWLDQDWK